MRSEIIRKLVKEKRELNAHQRGVGGRVRIPSPRPRMENSIWPWGHNVPLSPPTLSI